MQFCSGSGKRSGGGALQFATPKKLKTESGISGVATPSPISAPALNRVATGSGSSAKPAVAAPKAKAKPVAKPKASAKPAVAAPKAKAKEGGAKSCKSRKPWDTSIPRTAGASHKLNIVVCQDSSIIVLPVSLSEWLCVLSYSDRTSRCAVGCPDFSSSCCLQATGSTSWRDPWALCNWSFLG